MKLKKCHLLCLVLLSIGICVQQFAFAVDSHKVEADAKLPMTGKNTPGVQFLDEVVVDYFKRIDCSAATLAVSEKGVLVHSRGYGWSDKNRKKHASPELVIGIASCEKPITSAAIRQLAAAKHLDLDASVFKLLKIHPQGDVVDDRMWQITVRHLLDHKPGWQGDPLNRAIQAAHDKGEKDPIPVEKVLGYLIVQKLKDEPGTNYEYCNFCYDTLRHIIEKIAGHSAINYFRKDLFLPFDIKDLKGFSGPGAAVRNSDPPNVWNLDGGGPVAASAPAMNTFMHHFWLTGEPRDNANLTWRMYGSLPNSTAIMMWRPDGTDVSVVFNGRNDKVSHDEIANDLDRIIDRLKQQ